MMRFTIERMVMAAEGRTVSRAPELEAEVTWKSLADGAGVWMVAQEYGWWRGFGRMQQQRESGSFGIWDT